MLVVIFGTLMHAVNSVFEFLQKFQTEVVVDRVCYRRHGHNEHLRLSITQILLFFDI
jgi:2-oxoglutarate dehydrogenase complex dehydrogenase (E1) component-like enzyme